MWYCSLCCATKRSLVQAGGQTLSKSPCAAFHLVKNTTGLASFPLCAPPPLMLHRVLAFVMAHGQWVPFWSGSISRRGHQLSRVGFPVSSLLTLSIEKVQQLLPKYFSGHNMFGWGLGHSYSWAPPVLQWSYTTTHSVLVRCHPHWSSGMDLRSAFWKL